MNFELARQLIIERDDTEAIEAMIEGSEGTFFENYGDQEDWIVEAAAKAIGIDVLSSVFDDSEQKFYLRFGDRMVEVPPETDPTTHHVFIRTLNETLSPEFEFRSIHDVSGSYFLYMPLDPESWGKLEREFGVDLVDLVYDRLDFDSSVGRGRKPVKTTPVNYPLQRSQPP